MKYLGVKYIVFKMSAAESTSGDGSAAGPSQQLWAALRRASRSIEEYARRHVDGLGICPSDFGILAALLREGPLPVSALGRSVCLTSGSATTAIDRLEEKGLVQRRDDPADRRTRSVRLTSQGRALIRRADARHERALARVLHSLTATEQREAIRLLTKLGSRAEAGLVAGEAEGGAKAAGRKAAGRGKEGASRWAP